MRGKFWARVGSVALILGLWFIWSRAREKWEERDKVGDEEENPEEILRKAEKRNARRVERVEEVCRKEKERKKRVGEREDEAPWVQYSVFFLNKKHKLAYCPIYKAGTSTWLFNLLLLSGMTEDEISESGKQLSHLARLRYPVLDAEQAEQALVDSKKIITVRHPFERLLSAYRDKLENVNAGREHGTLHFYRSFGAKIVKKYRKRGNATKTWDLMKPSQYLWNPKKPRPEGIEPTFREFVSHLIDARLAHHADDHWMPYHLFCTPCLLRYDVVAKVETMNEDQKYAIRTLGLDGRIRPRWKHKTRFVEDKPSEVPSTLSRIYFGQLTRAQVEALHKKYRLDFELFDYAHEPYLALAEPE